MAQTYCGNAKYILSFNTYLFCDPADTPNSPVYCEMFFLTYAPDSTGNVIIVQCNIFFITIFTPNIMKMSGAVLLFHQNTPDIIFARKLYVRCEKI